MSNSLDWSEEIKRIAERKDLVFFLSNTKERDNLQKLIENRDKSKQVSDSDMKNLCIIMKCLSSPVLVPNNVFIYL